VCVYVCVSLSLCVSVRLCVCVVMRVYKCVRLCVRAYMFVHVMYFCNTKEHSRTTSTTIANLQVLNDSNDSVAVIIKKEEH